MLFVARTFGISCRASVGDGLFERLEVLVCCSLLEHSGFHVGRVWVMVCLNSLLMLKPASAFGAAPFFVLRPPPRAVHPERLWQSSIEQSVG